MKNLKNSLLAIAITTGLPALLAGQNADLRADIEAFIVTEVEGETILEPAEVANPGDIILYQAEFENQSEGPLSELKPTIPIPASLVYVAGSAKPEPQEVSTDGVRFQPFPALDASGEPLEASAIRAVRWHLETLDTGAPFEAELRAELLN